MADKHDDMFEELLAEARQFMSAPKAKRTEPGKPAPVLPDWAVSWKAQSVVRLWHATPCFCGVRSLTLSGVYLEEAGPHRATRLTQLPRSAWPTHQHRPHEDRVFEAQRQDWCEHCLPEQIPPEQIVVSLHPQQERARATTEES